MVVVNIEPEPLSYKLTINEELPAEIGNTAQHAFVNKYNVTIDDNNIIEDFVDGYGSNVLRFGNCGVVN